MQYTVKMQIEKFMCPKIDLLIMDSGILLYCCAQMYVCVEGISTKTLYVTEFK